jgi:hypothetical protein
MTYKKSSLTGNIYLGDLLVVQDDTLDIWKTYNNWLIDGGIFEIFLGTKDEILNFKNTEIETLRQKTETEIDAFISPYVQKLILRQVEIPVEVMQKYNAMRDAYQVKKLLILDK